MRLNLWCVNLGRDLTWIPRFERQAFFVNGYLGNFFDIFVTNYRLDLVI